MENSKGEYGKGQHEINMTYSDALTMADRHVVFKHGAKHLAEQHGQSITFMAKPYHGEAGSSCHIHLSLFDEKGSVFWDEAGHEPTRMFRAFPRWAAALLAGALLFLRADDEFIQALRIDELGAD